MKWFTNYFQQIGAAFSSLVYYRHMPKRTLGQSIQFFGFTIILLSFIASSRFIFKDIPKLQAWLTNEVTVIAQNYPTGLTIAWEDRQLHIDYPEPLLLPYPTEVRPQEAGLPTNLAIITPTNSFQSLESYHADHQDQALFYVIDQTIFIQNPSNSVESVAIRELLTDTPDFSITDQNIDNIAANIELTISSIQSQVWLPVIILMPLWLIVKLIWLTWLDLLLLFVVLKIQNNKFGWKYALKLHCHLIILAETTNQVALWLYGSTKIPLFSITYWLIASVIFVSWRSLQQKKFIE